MNALKEAIAAIKEALRLAEDVKHVGEGLKGLAAEVRDHERRITRLESKWETAMEFAKIAAGQRVESRLIGKNEGE